MAQLKPPIHKDLQGTDFKSALTKPKLLAAAAVILAGIGFVWFMSGDETSGAQEQAENKPSQRRERVVDPAGLVISEGFVKGTGSDTHTSQELFSNYSFTSRAARTYEMVFAPRKDDCSLTTPAQGTALHYVQLGNARMRSAIRAMSVNDMRDDIQELQLYNANNPTPRSVDDLAKAPGLRRADVLVTQTDRPVALVLEAIEEGTVWNIIQAPGVQLERVSFIAPGTSGVAVAPGPQVEGIDLKLAPQCRNAIRSLTNGGGPTIFADSALQVLVGPVPSEPVQYIPLDGRPVQILQNDVIFAPLDAEQGAQYFRTLYFDLMTQG
ncbi:MAG: hypothetical protein AAGD04_01010 [Pseudomonadota bacterium]